MRNEERGRRTAASGRRWALALVAALAAAGCAEAPGPSPEQQAVFAQEVDAEVVVSAVKNAMRYATPRVEAPAGATVRLVMDNSATTSPAMVHNVVVVATEPAVERVGRAASGDRLPDDPAILTATPLAGPGERTAVVFTMPPPGVYPFLCTYPGHFRFMQGTLVSTE
ncbi:plastocyanin/azurin family copper-binding protein [Rubrivirga sp.]|uniref:plastocyanin/azurin family copper-binding protein n=1 Tax=Rubrivirga sp. TaxID=1885344 RepID=UPI003B522E69